MCYFGFLGVDEAQNFC